MVEVFHLAAVLPATVGLCCAIGDRRGRARSVAPAAAMLAAMLAMAAGWTVVPALGWAALLAVLGVGAAAPLRLRPDGGVPPHTRHMVLHRALGLVLGAALLMVTSAGHADIAAAEHPAHAGNPLLVATLAGSAGYLVYTAWLVAASMRRRSPVVGLVEASAMGLMTALMAVAPLTG